MQHLLTTTFYYGTITRNGQQYQGIHQPLITKAVFDQTQFVMSGKNKAKTKNPLLSIKRIYELLFLRLRLNRHQAKRPRLLLLH